MRCVGNGKSRGMVLLMSLVVMMALAVLSATVLETSLLEVRLTTQVERKALARQAALGQLETWLDHLGTTIPGGAPGERHCPPGESSLPCEYRDLPADLNRVTRSEVRIVGTDIAPPPLLHQQPMTPVAHWLAKCRRCGRWKRRNRRTRGNRYKGP